MHALINTQLNTLGETLQIGETFQISRVLSFHSLKGCLFSLSLFSGQLLDWLNHVLYHSFFVPLFGNVFCSYTFSEYPRN